jgi:hypothetical protein
LIGATKNPARHKAAVKAAAATRGTVPRTNRFKPILTTRACLSAYAQKNSKTSKLNWRVPPEPQKKSPEHPATFTLRKKLLFSKKRRKNFFCFLGLRQQHQHGTN